MSEQGSIESMSSEQRMLVQLAYNNGREHAKEEIARLTLALSESEERGERWKAEAMAARDMHRSNVTLGARDGTATFRKWHDARALNDIKEPKAKETESRPSDPKPPA